MAKDPARSIIVIDPRLSETAALADFHLQIRPGTDAWCLAALVGIIVQDGLLARDWLAEHTSGYEHIVDELNAIPVAYCAETCGWRKTSCAPPPGGSPAPAAYRRWKTWACR